MKQFFMGIAFMSFVFSAGLNVFLLRNDPLNVAYTSQSRKMMNDLVASIDGETK